MKETLCWTCKRALGGCKWSRSLKPLKGWQAKKTRIYDNLRGVYVDSWLVLKCPLYVPDEPREKRETRGESISVSRLEKIMKISKYYISKLADDEIINLAANAGVLISIRHTAQKRKYILEDFV